MNAQHKNFKTFPVLVNGHVYIIYGHHMVILRSQNKITYFCMTLAWVSPFNETVNVIMNQNKATGVCPVNVRRSNKVGSVLE